MVLFVEDVGIYKPSRRVYRHAMQNDRIPGKVAARIESLSELAGLV